MTVIQASQADINLGNSFWNSVNGGDIIELVGPFAGFRFNDRDYRVTGRVTIDSSTADSMLGTYLNRVNGFVFTGDKWAPSTDASYPYAMRIDGGDDIVFDNATFTGPDPKGLHGDGLKFSNLSNARFITFRARRLIEAVTGSNASDWLSTDHEFVELSNDGWQIFGAKRCTWLDGSDTGRTTDPNQDPATALHPDGFQFPIRACPPSEDITIERCYIKAPGGQGIFLSNEDKVAVAHKNVTITDNRISAGAPRGISVDNGDGVAIHGNIVGTVPGSEWQGTIVHNGSVNVNDWTLDNYVLGYTSPNGTNYPPLGTRPSGGGGIPIPPTPTPGGERVDVINAMADCQLMLATDPARIAALNAVLAVP